MKRFIGTVFSLCAFVNLSGCATAPAAKYNDKISYASNLAASANAFVIKDTEVPKESIGDFAQNGISDVAWITAAGFTPPTGVTRGFSLGITAAAIIFGPKDPANKSRALIWVPKELVGAKETPREFAYKTISEAYKKTAGSYGLQSYTEDNKKNLGFTSSTDIKNTAENLMLFVLGDYKEVKAPDSMGSKESYLYSTDPYLDYSSNLVANKFVSINDFEFIVKLSSALPEWVVLYIKPGFVTINGETNKFPFILQSGKIHLFVIPK
ncbi:MAG TPA: hypothetical protein PK002_00805 [Cellvibrio sp.]|mgnify:CR=1 FL=1|nr:hypothetical protein [Cellvibrio sp.]